MPGGLLNLRKFLLQCNFSGTDRLCCAQLANVCFTEFLRACLSAWSARWRGRPALKQPPQLRSSTQPNSEFVSTIKDVAALAGVSFTTVSHVLNDTRPVSADARRRVLAAVEQIGYLPSAVARSLRKSETKIIGVLVPNVRNPFFAELVCGVEECCRLAGFSVFLCNSDNDPKRQQHAREKERSMVRACPGNDGRGRLRARLAAGFIIINNIDTNIWEPEHAID